VHVHEPGRSGEGSAPLAGSLSARPASALLEPPVRKAAAAGRSSPRKLLRALVARLLGRKPESAPSTEFQHCVHKQVAFAGAGPSQNPSATTEGSKWESQACLMIPARRSGGGSADVAKPGSRYWIVGQGGWQLHLRKSGGDLPKRPKISPPLRRIVPRWSSMRSSQTRSTRGSSSLERRPRPRRCSRRGSKYEAHLRDLLYVERVELVTGGLN
jgi:hypothetical protein